MDIFNDNDIRELAKRFFEKKNPVDYYRVDFTCEDAGECEACQYETFNEETIKKLKSIKAKNGQESFVDKLIELEPEIWEEIEDNCAGSITDIDVDNKCHRYSFAYKTIDKNDNVHTYYRDVSLSDEDYLQILCKKIRYVDYTFRQLEYDLPKIAQNINFAFSLIMMDGGITEDYLITLDGEVEKDIKTIFDEKKDPLGIWGDPLYLPVLAIHCDAIISRIHGNDLSLSDDDLSGHELTINLCGGVLRMSELRHADNTRNVFVKKSKAASIKDVCNMLGLESTSSEELTNAIRNKYANDDGLSRFTSDLKGNKITCYQIS